MNPNDVWAQKKARDTILGITRRDLFFTYITNKTSASTSHRSFAFSICFTPSNGEFLVCYHLTLTYAQVRQIPEYAQLPKYKPRLHSTVV